MRNEAGRASNSRGKFILLTAGAAALVVSLVAGVVIVPRLRAQAPLWPSSGSPKLTFEVASIKPNNSSDPRHWNIALGAGDFMRPVGGLFSVSNIPLRDIIAFAFKLSDNINYLMPGIPGWAASEKFDIEAKAEGTPTKDQFRAMMQALLADRFKLTIHKETRDLPVFAFVLVKEGKIGPQLTQHTDDSTCVPAAQFQAIGNQSGAAPTFDLKATLPLLPCGAFSTLQATVPGRVRFGARGITLLFLGTGLTGAENLDRPIIDRTGLNGTFDLWLEFTPQFDGPAPANFQPDPTGPSLQEALQEQLGLKLESQKAPVDVMVVDHLERPTAN